MAIFSVEIADADVARVLDEIAGNYRRQETIINPSYTGDVEAVDGNGDPILDEYGNPTYTEPVDENGDPIPEYIDNPESKAVFANRIVREFLTGHVEAFELESAKRAAAEAVDATVDIVDPQA